MACIENFWLHGHEDKYFLTAHVKLKPSGQAQVKVELPKDFYDCLMKIAQTAADLHEQQMRAQILADGATHAE